MSVSKLQNRDEFVRWYQDGKTYSWIIEKYQEKYGIEIGNGTISNWRHQLGLEARAVRNPDLIPWAIRPEHSVNHIRNMLHAEARRRGGGDLSPRLLQNLESWLAMLREEDAVVHYDPDTEKGWWLVKRRPGIDTDIIREPKTRTRRRGVRD